MLLAFSIEEVECHQALLWILKGDTVLEFFQEYGLFLAKAVTIVVAILIVIGGAAMATQRGRKEHDGHIEVKHLNEELDIMSDSLKESIIDKHLLKKERKEEKKREKAEAKARAKQIKKGIDVEKEHKKRVFVLDFDGDIKASEVEPLREEITSVLSL
ncbi:MAG: hypothetical protein OQK12_06800, partial [Motiliproteus sp.]|nr:hypothetical protein [Motiliproteus sp.]